MIDFKNVEGFEWDKGNVDKSFRKHGVSRNQSEEIFLDKDLKILKDIKHSEKEERYIVIGKTFQKVVLFAVFTQRANKVRIISARKANKKEKRYYEKT